MIVLGIDPGSYTTGFAVLEKKEKIQVLDYGAIVCRKSDVAEKRLVHIVTELEKIVETYKPNVLSMEGVFFAKNPKSAIMLGQVRGAVLVTCARKGLEFFEYSPRSVKMAVSGTGSASKEQVAFMLRALLNLPVIEGPLDASDALAIAFTHLSPAPLAQLICTKKKKMKKSDALRELAIRMGAKLP